MYLLRRTSGVLVRQTRQAKKKKFPPVFPRIHTHACASLNEFSSSYLRTRLYIILKMKKFTRRTLAKRTAKLISGSGARCVSIYIHIQSIPRSAIKFALVRVNRRKFLPLCIIKDLIGCHPRARALISR